MDRCAGAKKCWRASTCVIIFTWGVCCGIIGWVVIGEEDNSHSIMVAVCLGFLLLVAPLTGDSNSDKLITVLVLSHWQYFSKCDNHQCFEFTNNPCILYDGWLRLTAFINMRDDIYYVDPFLG